MTNYKELDECLQGRCRQSRKLANNTYAIRYDDRLAIRLHATDVVTYTKDGKVILDSGGWHTPTTKDRMNNFSPAYISQSAGVWYLGEGLVYQDGCYYRNGKWHKTANIKKVKDLTKITGQIKLYSEAFIKNLIRGNVPAPSGGDCWFCALKDEDGKTMGDNTDNGHFKNHFKENYFVPSLLVNAIEKYPVSQFAMMFLHERWYGSWENAKQMEWIAKSQIKKSLIRYLKAQFDIAS